MAERAMRARILAAANPTEIQSDENYLPWAFDAQCGYWFSFDGNYSASSPFEKVEAARLRKEEYETRVALSAEAYGQQVAYESYIRLQVLERDAYTCQICFAVGTTRFHVHHVLKRIEGGTDHLDNLLTVCPSCHRRADTKLYDPEWTIRVEA
jgi:hypothetical protein